MPLAPFPKIHHWSYNWNTHTEDHEGEGMQDTEVVFIGKDLDLRDSLTESLTTASIFLHSRHPDDLPQSPLRGNLAVVFVDADLEQTHEIVYAVSRQVGYLVPFVMIGSPRSLRHVVQAMRAGALDFLTPPLDDQQVFDVVREGSQRAERIRAITAEYDQAQTLLQKLSPREAQVMRLVVEGKMNKTIAIELQISEKTVEAHRYRLMRKLKLKSTVELVKFACRFVPGTLPADSISGEVPGEAVPGFEDRVCRPLRHMHEVDRQADITKA
ncbi:MAG: hypothetical protein D6753_09525 [Planctomycetota bacterium]|nr:MAG: hypothetical protein D6753_09525 [Planctomycetota bacterium]